jgi:putative phosphoesterase
VTVKIGLISDVHATPDPVSEALTIFQREGVDTILCAGDIAGYRAKLKQTVALLVDSGCQTVLGNHDLWWLSLCDDEKESPVEKYLRALPAVVEFSAEKKKIHMVHASPPESLMEGIKLFDENAELLEDQKAYWSDYLRSFPADVLIVGHTHQVFAEQLGDVLVINPGSTLFNHTCAILTLPEMDVQVFSLSGKEPVMTWNWGMFYATQS